MADRAVAPVEGVHISWSVWPNSQLEPSVPLERNLTVVECETVRCKNGSASCGMVLSRNARLDVQAKIWECSKCGAQNKLPPTHSSIEYVLAQAPPEPPPTFLFVVDTGVMEFQLNALKASLAQAVSLLPEESLVGLVTYGTHVYVHELGFGSCTKSYVFRGTKGHIAEQVQRQLGLSGQPESPSQADDSALPKAEEENGSTGPAPSGLGRFLLQLSDCDVKLTSAIASIQRDAFQPQKGSPKAVKRSTAAMSVAAALLSACVAGAPARIMLFVGGPENGDAEEAASEATRSMTNGNAPTLNAVPSSSRMDRTSSKAALMAERGVKEPPPPPPASSRTPEEKKLHAQDLDTIVRACFAASKGNVAELQKLSDLGMDPNLGDYAGRCPLHLASSKGELEACRFLINMGADVNIMDTAEVTPLQEAAKAGDDELCELLMQHGAKLMMKEPASAMCNAVFMGNAMLLRSYLMCGIDPDAADYDKRTALHIASAEGLTILVQIMLQYGADPAFRDRWGNTALDEARKFQHANIVAILERGIRERAEKAQAEAHSLRRTASASTAVTRDSRLNSTAVVAPIARTVSTMMMGGMNSELSFEKGLAPNGAPVAGAALRKWNSTTGPGGPAAASGVRGLQKQGSLSNAPSLRSVV